jgi:hypothetical protein
MFPDPRCSHPQCFHDDGGVWFQSVSALAALHVVCDVLFAEDLEDAYHLSAFAGWSWVLTLDSDGNIAWAWRLVLGCDPTTCLGFCDKAMSQFCIDGCQVVARFAAAHFGQRDSDAGSPLDAFMRAVLRVHFLASRHPQAPRSPSSRCVTECAEPLPGLGPQALHSTCWVDDTVFVTKTARHGPCSGLAGGCQCDVSAESARRAEPSQHLWHRLAARLGLDLSDDKRQTPSQRVLYTGLAVDTFLRTLSMPPDKTLLSFPDQREASLPDLASLRGRLQH